MAEILGIMVTKHENLQHITGVVHAARSAGKQVMIFMTDEGVRFTRDPRFLELAHRDGVDIIACDHSCKRHGISEKAQGISYGNQINNAVMLHDSARVLVF